MPQSSFFAAGRTAAKKKAPLQAALKKTQNKSPAARCAVLALSAAFASAALPLSAAESSDGSRKEAAVPVIQKLERVVVVSRHGLRAPTQSQRKLEEWSEHLWPLWKVPEGFLTKKGFDQVRSLWALNRKQSPFAYSMCPDPKDVRIIADVDERTLATAAALNEGLYRACGYRIETSVLPASALFSPLKAKVCRIPDREDMALKLSEKTRDFAERFKDELASLNRITGVRFKPDIEAKVSKYKAGFDGGIDDAASAVEIFALEWGEFPKDEVAWGRLDWSGILKLMPLRVAVFSALNRDAEIAAIKGSALAKRVMDSLTDGARYTYLIGHDTNLANLGALFDLNWKLPERARNENTPGGYLTFEKWLVGDQEEIRVYYSALSPAQMNAEKVTEPVQTYEIIGPGQSFKDWKARAVRGLFSECIRTEGLQPVDVSQLPLKK